MLPMERVTLIGKEDFLNVLQKFACIFIKYKYHINTMEKNFFIDNILP